MRNIDLLSRWNEHHFIADLSDTTVETLNVLAAMAEDRSGWGHYLAFICDKTCDCFDVSMLARWGVEEGLCTQTVVDEVMRGRKPYFTAQEVDARMKIADGSCPMCGAEISFSQKGAHAEGMYTVIGHCGHFRYNNVHSTDVVREARAWSGGRWPHWDIRVADDNGEPANGFTRVRSCCTGCRRDSARDVLLERVERILTEMVCAGRDEKFRGEYQSCPTSNFDAHWNLPGNTLDERVVQHIRQAARKIVDENMCEFRLNGAGLKLYTRGLRVNFRNEITFGMHVGGDQASSYPAFVAFANGLIEESCVGNIAVDFVSFQRAA